MGHLEKGRAVTQVTPFKEARVSGCSFHMSVIHNREEVQEHPRDVGNY
jgi:hypothetical protein